jgi:hypothetical protein
MRGFFFAVMGVGEPPGLRRGLDTVMGAPLNFGHTACLFPALN